MSNFDEIISNIRNLNQYKILRRTLNSTGTKLFIAELNTVDQLGLGLDSKGDVFGLYKSYGYSVFKQNLPGRQASFGVVDLRLTEDYWDSFNVIIESNSDIVIDSDPIKGDKNLIQIYGPAIEGLTVENMEVLIKSIIDDYIEETRKAIFQ